MEQQQQELLELQEDERLMREAMEEIDERRAGAVPWQPRGLKVRGMSIDSDPRSLSQMNSDLRASELTALLAGPRGGDT